MSSLVRGAALALLVGSAGCSDSPSNPGGAPPDECPAGSQDVDGDGICNPDCTATACVNGTCSVDAGSGLASCACDAGFEGDACDAVAPPDASGVAFWMDAADAASRTLYTDTSAIETWTEKGAQAIVGTTADSDTAPTLVEDAQNGLPVAHFDGVDDALTFAGVEGLKDTEWTLFAVMRAPEHYGTVVHGVGDPEALYPDTLLFRVGTDYLQVELDPNVGIGGIVNHPEAAYGQAGFTYDEFHLVTIRRRATDIGIWVDGNSLTEQAASDAAHLTETLALIFGRENGGDDPFEGDLGEVIIVPEALIFEDRAPYEDYLAAKWFGQAFARTPTAFGVTSVWLDASQTATVMTLEGGALTGWSNLGYGQGYFTSGVAENRPTLVEDGLHGLPVVRFDGGDAVAQNEVKIQESAFEGDYTILAVVVPPTTGDDQILFRATSGVDDDVALELELGPSVPGAWYTHRWPAGDSGGDVFMPGVDFSAPRIIKIERSGSGQFEMLAADEQSYFSGTEALAIGDYEPLHWILGGESFAAPGAGFLGDVAEFIVMDQNLGQSEEAALLALLREKWGL